MIYSEKEFIVKDNLKVVLKTPEVSEAKELLEFIKKITGQTDFLLSSSEDFKFDVEGEEKWIKANREGNDYFIAVYVDGKIVGDCSLNLNRHLKDKHRSSIGIGIDKEYWSKGIGSLLFDEMIKLAKNTKDLEQIELGVISTNKRAKRLYENKGFIKTGIIPNALKLKDGTYLDEELMTKFLYTK